MITIRLPYEKCNTCNLFNQNAQNTYDCSDNLSCPNNRNIRVVYGDESLKAHEFLGEKILDIMIQEQDGEIERGLAEQKIVTILRRAQKEKVLIDTLIYFAGVLLNEIKDRLDDTYDGDEDEDEDIEVDNINEEGKDILI